MDFSLSDEQRLVQQEARVLLSRHASPEAARAWQRDGGRCPATLWRALQEAGWPAYGLPAAVGGLGADLEDIALLFEECGRALVPSLLRTTVAAGLLLGAADRAEVLRGRSAALVRGDVVLADGRLRGEVPFVVCGGEADLLVVAGGTWLAAVARDAPGVEVTPLPIWAGESIARVRFADAAVEATLLEGAAVAGLVDVAREREIVLLDAELLGGFARVLELTVEYVKGRVQFGRPIGAFQAVQHQCADMATGLEASRALVRQAAWRLARGLPAARAVAIAHAWTTSRFVAATLTAHQLHGGMGFVTEYPLHLYSNRAKAGEALLGTPAEHMDRLARARGL